MGVLQRYRVLIAGAALLALYSAPVFLTVLPPLLDYPNHLARFWLLATGGNAFYAVHWAPLPNLAGDLIVPIFAQLLPVDVAGKLFLVMTFVLIVGGAACLNRVVAGGWRLWPLLSIAFLYNWLFLWGFTNYLFGLGLALCGTALWLSLERARLGWRIIVSSLMAVLCFFSHIAAFGVYALIIVGLEGGPILDRVRAGDWPGVFRRAVIAGPQFLIPVLVVLGSWEPLAQGAIVYRFWRKFGLLFSLFDDYSRLFDIACYGLLLMLFGALAWFRRLGLAPRLLPPIALIVATYFALPSQLLSGAGIDRRLPLVLVLLLVAGSAPRFSSRRIATWVGAAVITVLIVRLAIIETVWLQADRVYGADLAALDALPVGVKLAVAFPTDAVYPDAKPQIHVPTLAVWRRAAFVPTLFAIASQQPLRLNSPYDRLAAMTPPPVLWSALVGGERDSCRQLSEILPLYDAIVFVDRRRVQIPENPCLLPLVIEPNFQVFTLSKNQNCWKP
jgi:hypothetical protein